MAEIHRSRKLKTFDKAHIRKDRTDSNFAELTSRFRTYVPTSQCWGWHDTPSELVAEHGCQFQVDSDGAIDARADGITVLSLQPEGAYALYQLLDRAFGKD